MFMAHADCRAGGSFTRVINIPPSPNRGISSSIGSGTQLNLFDGGSIGIAFDAGDPFSGSTNIEVNIFGGTVAPLFAAWSGADVNVFGGTFESGPHARAGSSFVVSGGRIGRSFSILDGSEVFIDGGTFGDSFQTQSGSAITFSGGEFRLDGQPIEGLTDVGDSTVFNPPEGSLLTGVFADGTPFVFTSLEGDDLAPDVLTLSVAELPAVGPATIELPSDTAPLGIRAGQTLTVQQGGNLGDHFNAGVGSTVVVNGGEVGENFEAYGASVDILGGVLGEDFDAFDGTTVDISGGRIGQGISTHAGSQLNLNGGEFRLNGATIGSLETPGQSVGLEVPAGAVLSGVLSDGTPVAFVSHDDDVFANGTLTLTANELPDVIPAVIMAPDDPVPASIRGEQTLIVKDGGIVEPNFIAGHGSTVNVDGGEVGGSFDAIGAEVNVTGGSIGGRFRAYGSTVNISAGSIGIVFDIFSGSDVNLSGGSLSSSTRAFNDSVVNITGGQVGGGFSAMEGAEVTLAGGIVEDQFQVNAGSTLHISGGDFHLNGQLIEGLINENDSLSLNVPEDAVLSGTLADGTPFAFSALDNANSGIPDRGDLIADGTLTLTVAELPNVQPSVINIPSDAAPASIRGGQTLVVSEGGFVGDQFKSGWGSTVNMTGGQIGYNFEAVGTEVNISGGQVGDGFDIFSGSVATVSGEAVARDIDVLRDGTLNLVESHGQVGFSTRSGGIANIHDSTNVSLSMYGGEVNIAGNSNVQLYGTEDDSRLTITGGLIRNMFGFSGHTELNQFGGTIDARFLSFIEDDVVFNVVGGVFTGTVFARDQSVVNVAGGHVEGGVSAASGTTINMSGGIVDGDLSANDGSTVHFYGTEFLLDGEEIPGLVVGQPMTIGQRDVMLEGRWADGSPLSIDLRITSPFPADRIDADATLTITLIDTLTGDYNDDGVVNAADYVVWQNHQGQSLALPNEDPITTPGEVTLADYQVWRHNFGRTALDDPPTGIAVPEPMSVLLIALAVLTTTVVRRRQSSRRQPTANSFTSAPPASALPCGALRWSSYGVRLRGAFCVAGRAAGGPLLRGPTKIGPPGGWRSAPGGRPRRSG
jgi:hypothetical protein